MARTGTPVSLRGIVVTVFVVGATVLIGALAWLGVRAAMILQEVDALSGAPASLAQALATQDFDAAERVLGDIEATMTEVASLTADPLWTATESLPLVGANTTAVRVVAEQTTRLSEAGRAVLDAFDSDEGAMSGIDVARIRALIEPVERLEAVVATASDALGELRQDELVTPLAESVDPLITAVATANDVLPGAASAVRLAPDMLGAEEPRNILLVLQNNAELRTGGGLTGSFALLKADGGRLSLEAMADSGSFRERDTAIADVPSSTTEIYGDVVGRLVQNASMTADFPTTAKLASAWWLTQSAVTPDLLLAIDPIVLQSLLSVVGDVALPDGRTLTQDNLVEALLVDPYLTLDQQEQTDVQQMAMTAIFDRITGTGIDLIAWADALAEPVAEGRVALWSARPAERQVFEASTLGGAGSRLDAAGSDAVGVFFNDVTTAKLGTFLDAKIDVGTAACREDDMQDLVVRVTLTSRVPAEAVAYPRSMTGGANAWNAGDVATSVAVAAPERAFIGGVWSGDAAVPSRNAIDGGHPTSLATLVLGPGESGTLEFRYVVASAAETAVVHTPMINDVEISRHQPSCR